MRHFTGSISNDFLGNILVKTKTINFNFTLYVCVLMTLSSSGSTYKRAEYYYCNELLIRCRSASSHLCFALRYLYEISSTGQDNLI